MSRPNPLLLTAVLAVFAALFGGLSLAQGGLYLDTHEGDTYHLLDILYRMEQGLDPHVDFVTPLGLFAFLPIVLFMQAGLGVGMAILWAEIAIAAAMVPVVAYAAATRLPRRTAYAFGLFTIGLILAMTYGGAASGASISMHYNRWAWALAFTMLTLAILPARGSTRQTLDGILIGVLAACLLLIKITFFVCLLPPVAIALLYRGQRRAFAAAALAGLVVVAAVTAGYGLDHWLGYYNDLRIVAGSEVRPFVGVPFNQIVAGPIHVGGSILAILAVFLLRQSGRIREGLILVLLIPAFLYITYQNFGNDPKWYVFIAVLLMALRPAPGEHTVAGIDLSDGAAWLAAAAIALYFPSLFNMALSPINHAALETDRFIPMVPSRDGESDIFIRLDRANTITAEVYLDERVPVWAKYAEDAERLPPVEIGGVTFPHCEFLAGSRAFFVEIAADLERANIPEGSQFYTTDILTAIWLFGPYAPLRNGAPWYYGEFSGLENADYVLVPKCSFVSRVHRIMIDELTGAEVPLTLVRDNDLYALFEPDRGDL